jgi:hypothetical protein
MTEICRRASPLRIVGSHVLLLARCSVVFLPSLEPREPVAGHIAKMKEVWMGFDAVAVRRVQRVPKDVEGRHRPAEFDGWVPASPGHVDRASYPRGNITNQPLPSYQNEEEDQREDFLQMYSKKFDNYCLGCWDIVVVEKCVDTGRG